MAGANEGPEPMGGNVEPRRIGRIVCVVLAVALKMVGLSSVSSPDSMPLKIPALNALVSPVNPAGGPVRSGDKTSY